MFGSRLNILYQTPKLATHITQPVLIQTVPENSRRGLQLNDRSVGRPIDLISLSLHSRKN